MVKKNFQRIAGEYPQETSSERFPLDCLEPLRFSLERMAEQLQHLALRLTADEGKPAEDWELSLMRQATANAIEELSSDWVQLLRINSLQENNLEKEATDFKKQIDIAMWLFNQEQ